MTAGHPLAVEAAGTRLMGERWPGTAGSPVAVILHSAVTDRRSWRGVAELLAPRATVVTYDRRGFGETAPPTARFSHLADLQALLDAVVEGPVWLVGNSAGGRLALDLALVEPNRVAGLVLVAPAVSGAPSPALDPATQRLDGLIETALAAGDLEQANRWDTWLWLDGPGEREGRVGGAARDLALEMNALILRNRRPELAVPSGSDTWGRLAEVRCPVTVVCGDRDVPSLRERCEELARRLPRARLQVLHGVAHTPSLERPGMMAELLAAAVGA
ncbi:MAG: alpha/beta hydrolase [Candidatus Dormibacteria bacterium]|jgi:pimeloyl-ACP methyl ester carboxylesterase